MSLEKTLIVWDSQRNKEHFIRSVSFRTDASDFGFIVPTPSKPEIAEADSEAFKRLDEYGRPPRPRVATKGAASGIFEFTSGSVEVLEKKEVAGMEVAVLRANDVKDLSEWLKTNKYSWRPAFEKWLQPYLKRHWVLAAFRYSKKGAQAKVLETKTIRMTFNTDMPFYPYREPSDTKSDFMRRLDLYVATNEVLRGYLGKGSLDQPLNMSLVRRYDVAAKDIRTLLHGILHEADLPKRLVVANYERTGALAREDADLYFKRPIPAQIQAGELELELKKLKNPKQ